MTAPKEISILGQKSIFLGSNWTRGWIDNLLQATPKSSTYVLLTDRTLESLHLPRILQEFSAALPNGKRLLTFVMPCGEAFKTRDMKAEIEDFMISSACTRDSCLIAVGGGVVGDIGGFVAATFMRGIPVVQVPTTLLAMVDSSVGGKTAVDTPSGKNLIGAFWQPVRVLVDTAFLDTLPLRQFANGMAEIIKTGAFWSEALFAMCEINVDALMTLSSKRDTDILLEIITIAIGVKAHVVTEDEREGGLRGLLNFGHSIGHAIEAVFTPDLLHGEAVAIGMVKEAEVSRHKGLLKQVHLARLFRCLQSYSLPTALDHKLITDIEKRTGKLWSVERLLEIMRIDKKNAGAQKKLVLITAIGKTFEEKASNVDDDVIALVLSMAVNVHRPIALPTDAICLDIPGSKSISNRVLLMAALGEGSCRVHGLLHSDDTQVMLQALKQLGDCQYEWLNDGDTLTIQGTSGKLSCPVGSIYLGNAGTAARFLTTVCTLAKPTEQASTITITGNARMKQRPIGPLVDSLNANGASLQYLESVGCLPLLITPSGGLAGGEIRLGASVSSQYVSSVMISAPYASKPVTLILGDDNDGHVVSQPYIDMTIAMMKSFGIAVVRDKSQENVYHIPQGHYINPEDYHVEPDASSATYPLAMAAIHGWKVIVKNMGSSSLQGDAKFATDVLEPMGCSVTQSENETIVQGPVRGHLRPISSIDMEPMTDAFLTASVLAAVAQSVSDNSPDSLVTKITGIANQRVKECNRILAMVTELAKFGVEAWELPDGIAIRGKSMLAEGFLNPTDGVKCYDDHRVAMSFSVLSSAVAPPSGIIIQEKKSVEKTWPSWWDVLVTDMHVPVSFYSDHRAFDHHESKSSETHASQSSIILIGMRGVGKTTLGSIAAADLGYNFIDIDEAIAASEGMPCREVIDKFGWPHFRQTETKVFAEIIGKHSTKAVISCGGGVVESDENRKILLRSRNSMHIVHIERDIASVIAELNSCANRPPLGEDLLEVYKRRLPYYLECRTRVFHAVPTSADKFDWYTVSQSFKRIIRVISGASPELERIQYPASVSEWSHFVSLTCSDVNEIIANLREISTGADALELRVDFLDYSKGDEYIGQQVATLRQATTLPIIFTVRTKHQCGRFPNEEKTRYFELLRLGIDLACEFVDVEIENVSAGDVEALISSKGTSKIIASFHDTKASHPWRNVELISSIVSKADLFGDILKIIMTASNTVDNLDLQQCLSDPSSPLGKIEKPLIALNMGKAGQMSRILNKFFTPITHRLLPTSAAPGQLSLAEIFKARCLLGMVDSRRFFLLGSPISHSKSPSLHNGWFAKIGLDSAYKYELFESETVSANLLKLINSQDFGGASVTIPLKELIIHHLISLTAPAKAIGAVNTIIPHKINGESVLRGDNTDWLGMQEVINSKFSNPHGIQKILIVGAGGTARAACYCAKSICDDVHIWNRTHSRALELQSAFLVKAVADADLANNSYDLIISTIPGYTQEGILNLFAGVFATGKNSMLLEMAYEPEVTPFMKQAQNQNWTIGKGLEVLEAQ
eukprot:Partr_v1_DN28824_c0_g1_i2_m33386 putative The AROM polypeptide catalyzes 5 consecutive enzymatic reactions in prechorismate polyaromatic amino acid biosynthesis (By similarity)